MNSPLTVPVWKATPRTRSAFEGTRTDLISHAIRGGHTLCGLTTRTRAWQVVSGPMMKCQECAAVPDGYATHNDLLDLGLTYRKVDYWCTKGHLRSGGNPGSGQRRYFRPDDVAVAVVIAALTEAGVSLAAAARAARNGGRLAPGVRVVVDPTVNAAPAEALAG